MERIKVTICEGTTCYVMGGNTIKSMLDVLLQKYSDKVEITSASCLGECDKSNSFSKAPYVIVEDEVISSADLDKVFATIEKRLNK